GGQEAVLRQAEEMRIVYREGARLLPLPPDQFDREWDKLIRPLEQRNVVAALLAPALGKVRRSEGRFEARQALWRAALAIQTDGPDALKAQRDPFGDGPFERTAFEGGYELRSQLKALDKQVSLTVGKKKE